MRLVTARPGSGAQPAPAGLADSRLCLQLPDGLVPLGALADVAPSWLPDEIERLDLAALLAIDPDLGAIREALAMTDPAALQSVAVPLAAVRLGPPIPRPLKIVCVGLNYLDHLREQHKAAPDRPVLFAKFANAVIGDGDPIRRPAGTHALDLEAELAVVIGRRASRVPAGSALRHVAGYSAANDVSARDWQGQPQALGPGERGDGQWLRAKGSDTFLPLGPAFVSADEIPEPGALAVRSWRTAADGPSPGQPFAMQDGSTADLLWNVARLIEFISASISLEPGDVVITGTPAGVGVFRDPPVFLMPGDLVRVEIERIGSLTNPIADENGRMPPGSPAEQFLLARRSTESGSAAGVPAGSFGAGAARRRR